MLRIRGRSFTSDAYRSQTMISYDQCEKTCENEQNCVGFSYSTQQQMCRMFNSIQGHSADQDTDIGIKRQQGRVAVVASPIAPAVSSTSCDRAEEHAACPMSAAEERALRPKDTFKECDACPEMIVVPAGSFTMGSPESEERRSNDEGPQHVVTFERPFAVGRFEVSFDQWQQCVLGGGCNRSRLNNGNSGWIQVQGNTPIILVSWDDAKDYAAWLSKKTGRSYRLLSEAEREYVMRAGTTTTFWWGNSIAPSQRGRLAPVNFFDPNPWGLYQVHGNVYDWTADCYHDSYQGAPTDGSPWRTGNCNRRVLRGGAFDSDANKLRSAARYAGHIQSYSLSFGIRVARTLLTP